MVIPFAYVKRVNKSKVDKESLTKVKPNIAVLGLLDIILDYCTLDDLIKLACVNKYFMYVSTMDKLLIKFDNMYY